MQVQSTPSRRKSIDFEQLNQQISARYTRYFEEFLPDGRIEGPDYVVISPFRNDRNAGSFRVNIQQGKFYDFADPSTRGGDFIFLTAKLLNSTNYEAALHLIDRFQLAGHGE